MKKTSLLILIISYLSYGQTTKPFDMLDKSLFSEKEDGLMYYEDTLYSGEVKEYNESGNIKEIWNYSDGEINGEFKEYYESGNIKEIWNLL
jgi:antitoxin component YwqK of YwqJK toxin-antitoxin module